MKLELDRTIFSLAISLFVSVFIALPACAQLEVDTSGKVGIGTSSPSKKLEVAGDSKFTDNMLITGENVSKTLTVERTGATTGTTYINYTKLAFTRDGASYIAQEGAEDNSSLWFLTENKNAMRIDETQHVSFYNGHSNLSDERLKGNIQTLDGALSKVLLLRGVSYIRNDIDDSSRKAGFIAQEVQQVLPEVVHTLPHDGYFSVEYDRIIPVLVEAIKTQNQQIVELQNRLSALE